MHGRGARRGSGGPAPVPDRPAGSRDGLCEPVLGALAGELREGGHPCLPKHGVTRTGHLDPEGQARAAVTATPDASPHAGALGSSPSFCSFLCGLFRGTPPHTLLFRRSAEKRRPLISRSLATQGAVTTLSAGASSPSPLPVHASHARTHGTRAFLQSSPARTHPCLISVVNAKPASAPESPHPPGKTEPPPQGQPDFRPHRGSRATPQWEPQNQKPGPGPGVRGCPGGSEETLVPGPSPRPALGPGCHGPDSDRAPAWSCPGSQFRPQPRHPCSDGPLPLL